MKNSIIESFTSSQFNESTGDVFSFPSTDRLQQPSPFVIFLNISGVLYKPIPNKVHEKIDELFPRATMPYDNIMYAKAACHCLYPPAVELLTDLTRKIKKIRDIRLVITSDSLAGVDIDIEELRKQFFDAYEFSAHVVGITCEENLSLEEENLSVESVPSAHLTPYAKKICLWLKKHPEIENYSVLHHTDGGLSVVFKERFFRTDYSALLTGEICEGILSQAGKDRGDNRLCRTVIANPPGGKAVLTRLLEYIGVRR